MKTTLAVAFALGLLLFTGSALGLSGAASFTDVPGDDNAAPDITSVAVVDSSPSSVTLKVVAPNYPVLEQGTWFNLYFDIDANPMTGILGGERLVRYVNEIGQNTGIVTASTQLFTAVGNNWATLNPTHIDSAYNAGELTLTIPRTALGGADPLGVHVISGRRQPMGAAVFISSDFAPNQGCCINWAGTATAASADPTADHEAAPDITSVSVTDTKDGWIRFAITTPNYERLRGEDTLVFLQIDTDFRRSTGQVGADYALGHIDGAAYLDRWSNADRRWINRPGRVLVRTKNANNVVTIDVHRSELGDVRRFQFRVTSAVMHFFTGLTFGVDQAPDIRTTYWGYKFANKTTVRLLAGRAVARPAQPRAGARFTIGVPLKRSDTNRAITSGTVTCKVRVAGRPVQATGGIRAGRAECAFVVPQKGKAVSGSLTVRSAKVSATSRFSFRIRR